MHGRKLARGLARSAVASLMATLVAACAHAPSGHEPMSILDLMQNQQSAAGPASCAALNATSVCEKSTRLDTGRSCRCVDPQALNAGGGALRL